MNAAEYNTEIGKINKRAIEEGITKRKLSVFEVVAVLETQKFLLLQLDYEQRQLNAANRVASAILKPGDGGFSAPLAQAQ